MWWGRGGKVRVPQRCPVIIPEARVQFLCVKFLGLGPITGGMSFLEMAFPGAFRGGLKF
jgi:hypothetical protein